MISVEEARARILAGVAPLPAEQVGLTEGLGRVLAEPLVARVTQPPLAVSAMDGYAVRAADTGQAPALLRQVGYVPAGARHEGRLEAGTCVRIFTGAPLPEGADAIVIQEDVEADGERITVRDGVAPGRHVRRAGLDFAAGDTLLRPGRRLSARDVGLAAAMNRPWLRVARRPRVAILPTGDEIAMPGDPIGPNQIVSANGLALAAFVREAGGVPIDLGIARDDRGSLVALAAAAMGADLLVTTGGASVGDHDLIRSVLGEEGLEIDFWQIAMRPGKPLMWGRLRGTAMLGLPGNPVSALVCALLFLGPLLARLQGRDGDLAPAETVARLGAPLAANDRRQDYLRARLARDPEGGLVATPFAVQDSSMMTPLAEADALVVRAPHAPPATAGDPVRVIVLGQSGCAL